MGGFRQELPKWVENDCQFVMGKCFVISLVVLQVLLLPLSRPRLVLSSHHLEQNLGAGGEKVHQEHEATNESQVLQKFNAGQPENVNTQSCGVCVGFPSTISTPDSDLLCRPKRVQLLNDARLLSKTRAARSSSVTRR